MHLLRCLVFVEAQHQCHLVAKYIDTKSNHLADDLSRNRASSFLFKVPEADHHPSLVSLPLLSLLLDCQADWTSPTWRRQFWRYLQAGLAPSTQKTYQSAMHRFHNFCTTYNVTSPFPLTEQLLCTYASYLANQQLTPQTIKSYLSALRSWQISLVLPDPRDKSSLPMLKRVQAGISQLRLMKGSQARIRLPIMSHLLWQIKQALDRSFHPAKLVIWAVASTVFFGFFRLGELLLDSAQVFNESTCLSWGDVAVDNRSAPSMIQIHLKKSKCD